MCGGGGGGEKERGKEGEREGAKGTYQNSCQICHTKFLQAYVWVYKTEMYGEVPRYELALAATSTLQGHLTSKVRLPSRSV